MIVKHVLRLLIWIGLVRYRYGTDQIKWPVYVAPAWIWRNHRALLATCKMHGMFYVFRNKRVNPHIPGRLLPRRWGFGFFGLIEFGDRG